jgi:DNA-binding IclR family transcriptional regulator
MPHRASKAWQSDPASHLPHAREASDPGLSVGKLRRRLGVPPSTLSDHLKTLAIVGLMTQEGA